MLRDIGCTTFCISTKFADQLNMTYQEEKWISLANESECLYHEVEVSIDSPYISDTVIALSMDYPFADVILGETAFVKKHTILEKNRSDKMNIKDQLDQYIRSMPQHVQDSRMTGKGLIVNKSDKMSQ